MEDKDRDFWRRQLNHMKSLDPGCPFDFDIRLKLADGRIISANLNCLRVVDNYTGSILRVSLMDITERKKQEDALRISATAFETQDGILVTDTNNVILRVNSAFTRITGYSSEEVIGQTPRMLSSGENDKAFYAAMWASIYLAGKWQGELTNRRKGGERYPAQLSITAVKNAEGVVINYVAILIDLTTSKADKNKITHLAYYDTLTLLPNRHLFTERLHQAIAVTARGKGHGGVLFLDLDNFKTLNDTHGHNMGDLLLQQVAQRLTECVRVSDTAARMGGDEFVILLESLSENRGEAAAKAKATGQQVLKAINAPYMLNGHPYHSSASIGITLFNQKKITSEEVLKQADIAMYQAKSSGRDAIRFYDPEMQEIINTRAKLEQDLRIAIEQQQFELYYQTQVDSSGQILGAEALIRWHHPERGLISPAEFIPVAEEVEFILPIGQWVLETACAQLQKWQQHPATQKLSISINVSAKQFSKPDFVEQVKSAITRYGIAPKLLNLELTESLLLHDIEDTIVVMEALKSVGIRFELDDFGTGYSSLQYLKMLPLYRLKIDQSFVKDIDSNNSDRVIVRIIIAIAQSLGLKVIAEGVESEAMQECLLAEGCTVYQGDLFGKPVSISELETLLRNSVQHIKPLK